MNEQQIKILAKFFTGERKISDTDIDELCRLDDMYKDYKEQNDIYVCNCLIIKEIFKMKVDKVYWITGNGQKIDIDKMSIEHLRNTLKMIVRKNNYVNKTCPHNIDEARDFKDLEIEYDSENYYNWRKNRYEQRKIETLTI
jgi:hypothetical protein